MDVVFNTLLLVYPRERIAVPIKYRPVWTPGSKCTVWRRDVEIFKLTI